MADGAGEYDHSLPLAHATLRLSLVGMRVPGEERKSKQSKAVSERLSIVKSFRRGGTSSSRTMRSSQSSRNWSWATSCPCLSAYSREATRLRWNYMEAAPVSLSVKENHKQTC